ncbi:ester cyclase [Luteolibacter sp. GHJ8]|uniref:Ester cyclase n=1 Tax=Luteolibacter rhizosphaerae TaxID=2989719 RepID=A0ABT3GA96_9BACT|nr:ester cyclase [Luteolibacter rhizosphaerae]MCW1916562.1 ester cyclase [Luteolibacter rhizosphaerae]
MPDAERRKEILSRFLKEVWTDGDADAAERYIAPSYTIRHDPGDPWDGKLLDLEGYKERVRISRAPFPDQRFEVQELFADGDAVVVTWLWSAPHLGEIPSFPASGKTIRMSGATVYYFDGDRLTGHWQITDRLGVYRQLSSP